MWFTLTPVFVVNELSQSFEKLYVAAVEIFHYFSVILIDMKVSVTPRAIGVVNGISFDATSSQKEEKSLQSLES